MILLDILFRDLNRELGTVTQIQIHWSPIDGSYTGALPPPRPPRTGRELNSAVAKLTQAIQTTIDKVVPKSKPTPYSKRWWMPELREAKQKMRMIGRAAYANRLQRNHPIHQHYRKARNKYTELIRHTKRQHWGNWLEEVDENKVWTASNMMTRQASDGGKVHIPDLQGKDLEGRPTMERDNEAKGKLLYEAFFPTTGSTGAVEVDPDYPLPAFKFEEVSDTQIHKAILKLSPYKAPGPSGIPNVILKYCCELLVPHLGPIYRATFTLGAYPSEWKVTSTITLHKPGKPDYTLAKAYCPITLGECLAKVLSSCIAETLVHHTMQLCLLPDMHFGRLPGWSTTDALHLVVKFIKDAWRRGEVVSALFLDVKGAFPSQAAHPQYEDEGNP